MKHCIVEDSSFIVATMDKNDAFHKDAVFIFKKLLEKRDKLKIIIPPLGLYEIIVTLTRKGIKHNIIEQKILNLLHIDEIIVSSITEASAFKHCKTLLNILSQKDALRTSDFLLTSLAKEYEAQIITFDKKAWQKIKPVYNRIYYCSPLDSMKDESKDFLDDLSKDLCEAENNFDEPNIRDIPF